MKIKRLKQFFCVGKFSDVPVKVETDAGLFTSKIKGQIILQAIRKDTNIKLRIRRFSAIADSVECKAGPSGLISLGFVHKSARVRYEKSGNVKATLKMDLHYPLINEKYGFRRSRMKEKDNFVPHVALVKGKISGAFKHGLRSIATGYKSFDKPPSTDFSMEVSLVAERYSVKNLVFVEKIKMLFPVAFMHRLRIQPVFIRSGPGDASPTGWSFDTLIENARVMWRKCCIELEVLPPIYIDDASYKSISTEAEVNNLRALIADDPDAIEIFVTRSLGNLENAWGGGASFSSGTANAQIVTCDRQLEVFDGSTSHGAVNYNHLAHELGHVLSLHHPGVATFPPMIAATANTVMEPSGFYADNPHSQSKFNCDNADNPVLDWILTSWSRRCRQNPEL